MKAIITALALLLYKGRFRFRGKDGFCSLLQENKEEYPIKIQKVFYIYCTKEKVYYNVFSKDWK